MLVAEQELIVYVCMFVCVVFKCVHWLEISLLF